VKSRLRDALVVARFDLSESLRSRRALVLLLLFVAGSMAAAGVFVTVLREVENALAAQLQVAAVDAPGAMTDRLLQSPELVEVLAGLLGDEALARKLLTVPPLALFYGWVATFFAPPLVVFTCGDSIASEVQSGSARFALFRTDRLSWATGKLLGQALLLLVGMLAGAAGVWLVGLGWLGHFAPLDNAAWLLRLALRAWVYSLAFLGLSLGVSQVLRTRWWALGGALSATLFALVLGEVLDTDWAAEQAPVLVPTLAQLFPGVHRLDLWRPELAERLPALVILPTLGAAWFYLGHLVFARRDA
jgi:ABC-type transport system involved in multi-copper enzyme maturation permease subunit